MIKFIYNRVLKSYDVIEEDTPEEEALHEKAKLKSWDDAVHYKDLDTLFKHHEIDDELWRSLDELDDDDIRILGINWSGWDFWDGVETTFRLCIKLGRKQRLRDIVNLMSDHLWSQPFSSQIGDSKVYRNIVIEGMNYALHSDKLSLVHWLLRSWNTNISKSSNGLTLTEDIKLTDDLDILEVSATTFRRLYKHYRNAILTPDMVQHIYNNRSNKPDICEFIMSLQHVKDIEYTITNIKFGASSCLAIGVSTEHNHMTYIDLADGIKYTTNKDYKSHKMTITFAELNDKKMLNNYLQYRISE